MVLAQLRLVQLLSTGANLTCNDQVLAEDSQKSVEGSQGSTGGPQEAGARCVCVCREGMLPGEAHIELFNWAPGAALVAG